MNKSWFGEQLELPLEGLSRGTNSPRATEPATTITRKPPLAPTTDSHQPPPPVYNAQLYRRAGTDLNEGTT